MLDSDHPTGRQPRRFGWFIAVVSLLALFILTVGAFLGIGRWLVLEDPLTPADAIVVLSGRMPVRALEAARLYKQGYAQQVWLTRAKEPAASLQQMHIPYIGEDFYDSKVLMHEGVPSNAIRVLQPEIVNTADEIQSVAYELQQTRGHTVIIVTSKAHTRRVHVLWRRLAPSADRAIVRAASADRFDPRHWWDSTTDALEVMRETLGLLNAWAGLPLKPSP